MKKKLQAHSFRVNLLRRIFPVLALGLLALVALWPLLHEWRVNLKSRQSATRLKVEAIALSMPKAGQPLQLQVTKPEYSGLDDMGRPYVITAERVIQDGLRPGTSIMNLEQPVARLVLDKMEQGAGHTSGDAPDIDARQLAQQFSFAQDDNTQAETIGVSARTGVYDPDKKALDLDGDVVITHSAGYRLEASELYVDLLQGRSLSPYPVQGKGPAGSLQGEQLELLDKGNHIILHGKSRVILYQETPVATPLSPQDQNTGKANNG